MTEGSGGGRGGTNPPEDDRTIVNPAGFGSGSTPPPGSSPPAPGGGVPAAGGAAGANDEMPSIPGLTLAREIARGGMGVVYRGRQDYLDRDVAVKLLSAHLSGDEFAARFQREAKILAGIKHPNIVACHTAGTTDAGQAYLVMEFIDGPNLKYWVDEHGPMDVTSALRLARGLAAALGHAAEQNVIHRDIKGENVLLESTTSTTIDPMFPFAPKLVDLGLARVAQGDSGPADMGLTSPGAVMGTPSTMSPEQFDDPDNVDFRTDIYGLGCVLYRCLTGKPAFDAGSLTTIIALKREELGPDPCLLRPIVPKAVGELVRRMLACDRERRPASYPALIAEIDELLTVRPGPKVSDEKSALLKTAELSFLMEEEAQKAEAAAHAASAGDPSPDLFRTQVPGAGSTAGAAAGPAPATAPDTGTNPTVVEPASAPPGPGGAPWILGGLIVVALAVGGAIWKFFPGEVEPPDGGSHTEAGEQPDQGGDPGSGPGSGAGAGGGSTGSGAQTPAVNRPPTVAIAAPETVQVGAEVDLRAVVADMEGDDVRLSWAQISGPRVSFADPRSAATTLTVEDGLPFDKIVVQVQVDDGHNTPVTDKRTFQVEPFEPTDMFDAFDSPESAWTNPRGESDPGVWRINWETEHLSCMSDALSERVFLLPDGVWRIGGQFTPGRGNQPTFSETGVRIEFSRAAYALIGKRTGAGGQDWSVEVLEAERQSSGDWIYRPLDPEERLTWKDGEPGFGLITHRDGELVIVYGCGDSSYPRRTDLRIELPRPVAGDTSPTLTLFSSGGRSIYSRFFIW